MPTLAEMLDGRSIPYRPTPSKLAQALMSPEDDFAYGQGIPADATWRNLIPFAEFALGMSPGSGEAMSARDAWDASGRAGNALLEGRFTDAAGDYLNMGTSLLGAIPGAGIIARGTKRGAAWMDRNLPEGFNRLMDAVYPQGYVPDDTTFAIPAWHVSPYKFDQFDMSKIGTGEGAQAFGRGLYFAEDPKVGLHYYNQFKTADANPYFYNVQLDVEPEQLINLDKPFLDQTDYIRNKLTTLDAPAEIRNADWITWGVDNPRRKAWQMRQSPSQTIAVEEPDGTFSVYGNMGAKGQPLASGFRTLEEAQASVPSVDRTRLTGERAITQLDKGLRPGAFADPMYIAALKDHGIPGIRYLDGFSRHGLRADRDAMTENYVIFDDKLVKILGRGTGKK